MVSIEKNASRTQTRARTTIVWTWAYSGLGLRFAKRSRPPRHSRSRRTSIRVLISGSQGTQRLSPQGGFEPTTLRLTASHVGCAPRPFIPERGRTYNRGGIREPRPTRQWCLRSSPYNSMARGCFRYVHSNHAEKRRGEVAGGAPCPRCSGPCHLCGGRGDGDA